MISTNHCQIKNLPLSLSHDIHLQIPHRRQLLQRSQAPHRSRPVTPPRPKPIPVLPEYLVHVVPRPQHHSVAEIPHPQPQHLAQLQLPLPLQLTPDSLRIQHHLARTPSTPAAHQKHLPIFPPHPLPIPPPIDAPQPLARQSIPPNSLRVPAPPVLAYSGGIRTPIPIESGQESGRCRTALRSLPDRIPAASGQQSGTVRTEFRSDPDNVPGHPDSVGRRPEWGGGKGS